MSHPQQLTTPDQSVNCNDAPILDLLRLGTAAVRVRHKCRKGRAGEFPFLYRDDDYGAGVDLSKTMACPACGNIVAVTDQFCPKCFARLEPPSLWRKFLSLFQPAIQSSNKSHRPLITIKKTVDIRTTDKDGVKHEYHSLNEVPAEMRAEIEKLESAALGGMGASTSASETSQAGSVTKSRFVFQKDVSVYKVRDVSGNERVYHSLEELPPEIRAAFEKARNKIE